MCTQTIMLWHTGKGAKRSMQRHSGRWNLILPLSIWVAGSQVGELGIVWGDHSHEEGEERDDGRHRGQIGELVDAVGDELWPLLVPLEHCCEERHQARRGHQRLEACGTRQGGTFAWTISLAPTKVALKGCSDILYDHPVS